MNYYPRHLGDYIRDTVGLTMLEDGAYTRLLDQYYIRERPLPADATIYLVARATTKAERAAVDLVLRQFFVKGDDGWHQKRADLEIGENRKRSESARQSALRRWNGGNANASANALRTYNERSTNVVRTQYVGNASQKPNNTLGLSSAKDCAVDNSGQNPAAINAEKQVKTASTPHDWWRSNDGIDAKAREVGMAAKLGETYPDFKNRIFTAISEREQRPEIKSA